MKTNLLNISLLVLLSAVSLCGCSHDDEPVATATDGTTLTVTARADGFAPTDGTAQTDTPQTRASESGYTTTFVKDDRIGVFAMKDGNVIADCKNLPCTYDGTNWNSSTPVYKYTGATYFAYYPYIESMNDKTSVDAIVEAFNTAAPTATDQSTYANYTACDLMTATVEPPIVGTSLSFSFTHRMSLIEISLPVQKYKTSGGADAYEYSAPVLGAAFSLAPSGGNATTIQPCPMGKGIYRYIVPAGTSGATLSGMFNTADGKTIEYTKSSLSLSAGNYKRLNVTYSGAPSDTPTERALAVGDYYYSDGSICPGTTSNPPSQGCIGIVFWLGDATEKDATLKAAHPGCTHGLVVALQDASERTAWQDPRISVQDWLNSNMKDAFLAVESDMGGSDPLNNIQGYNNTKAIEAFNTANSSYKVQAVEAVVAYRTQVKAPDNSSDWYLPSEKELTLLCGKEVSDIGTNHSGGTVNRDLINGKLGSISGTVQIPTSSANYWSSTEDRDTFAFYVYFVNGNVGNYYKSDLYSVRSALAF